MKMTEKQIAEEYLLAVDKKVKIKNLADVNDCTPSEIREILENQDVLGKNLKQSEAETPIEKPKRGRPPMTEDEKLEAKLDKAAKTIQELRQIPSSLEVLVSERIEILNNSIEAHQRMIIKNQAEKAELEAFLNERTVRDM